MTMAFTAGSILSSILVPPLFRREIRIEDLLQHILRNATALVRNGDANVIAWRQGRFIVRFQNQILGPDRDPPSPRHRFPRIEHNVPNHFFEPGLHRVVGLLEFLVLQLQLNLVDLQLVDEALRVGRRPGWVPFGLLRAQAFLGPAPSLGRLPCGAQFLLHRTVRSG
jgi:hypothetical protein